MRRWKEKKEIKKVVCHVIMHIRQIWHCSLWCPCIRNAGLGYEAEADPTEMCRCRQGDSSGEILQDHKIRREQVVSACTFTSAGSTFLYLMVSAIPRSHRVTPAGLPMSHPRGQCPLPHPTSADDPTVEERGCAVLDPFIKLLAHLP